MRVILQQLLILLAFLIAYCIQPILVDAIKFSGGANSSTFLVLLPHYYAMVLVGLLPKEKPLSKCGYSDWKKGFILCSLDIINQLLKKAGLVYSGAAIYIIVESSSMVWTVLWSKLLLQRKLHFLQWISIILISFGIALRSCQLTFHIHNEEFVGVLLILTSSILMGLTFVLFELFVNHPTEAVPGPSLVFMMGVICSVVMSLWQCLWTIPQFDSLVVDEIREKNGNPYYVFLAYVFLLIAGFIHSATLWYLLKVLGAVSSGVLKGLKVAGVFVLSHFLFCKVQPSQCFNAWSASSAIVCTVGVVLYSVVTASYFPPKPPAILPLCDSPKVAERFTSASPLLSSANHSFSYKTYHSCYADHAESGCGTGKCGSDQTIRTSLEGSPKGNNNNNNNNNSAVANPSSSSSSSTTTTTASHDATENSRRISCDTTNSSSSAGKRDA